MVKNNQVDDSGEIQRAIRAQQTFDERAFLEFKNFIDKEFDKQEEVFKLLKNPKSDVFRQKSIFEEDNRLILFTPDGRIVREFKDIEGIYDSSKTNLGFLVASWTGFFIGLQGYDPDHGHNFKKDLKERQIRDSMKKLETKWQSKRNQYSYSNSETQK